MKQKVSAYIVSTAIHFGTLAFLLSISTSKCDFPFRNVSLPFDERVADLVSRLTVNELVDQMNRGGGGGDGGPVLPIERLGINEYWWGTECIHGDIYGNSTAFPQSIGLAATFKYAFYHLLNMKALGFNNDLKTGGCGRMLSN